MAGLGSSGTDPVHATQEAAERARAAARESAHWLRDEASRLYANYSKQSKYFKWRTWIVGAYLAVVVASVVVWLPPFNHIDAYVLTKYDDFDGKLIVSVKNESTDEWTRVRVLLDDTWEFEKDRVPPSEWVNTNVLQFKRIGTQGGDGNKPGKAFRARSIKVKCDQGTYTASLAE